MLYLVYMILPYLFADFIINFPLITLVAYTNESLVRTIHYTVQKMSHYPSNNVYSGKNEEKFIPKLEIYLIQNIL